RSQVHALDVIAYTGDTVRLSLHVGSGTYVRSIADALGGHCLTLRRTAVGPFAIDEAVSERWLSVADALGRLPAGAVARVPAGVPGRGVAAGAGGGGAGGGEGRTQPRGARPAAARRRDRDVRRCPRRPPGRRGRGSRSGPATDGGDLSPAPPRGARQSGLAARNARPATGAARCPGRRGDARRGLLLGGGGARAGGVRARLPRGDRDGARRRR